MSVDYRKILVPWDGSAFAAQALPHGVSLAQKYGAELILLRVITENVSALENLALDLSGMEEASSIDRRSAVEEVQAQLTAQVEKLSDAGLQIRGVILEGSAAESIIDYAGAQDIDLIVMSTHGRSGVQRMVYGSVAEKVLRGAGCPVLLVRLRV